MSNDPVRDIGDIASEHVESEGNRNWERRNALIRYLHFRITDHFDVLKSQRGEDCEHCQKLADGLIREFGLLR